MNLKKDFTTIIVAYVIVIIYVIFGGNVYISALLVLALAMYHIVSFSRITKTLNEDKETSLSKLLTRLDKSKQKQEESYKRFISLSTNLGSGLLMIDDEGNIQLANKDINEFFNRDFNDSDYQKHTDIKSFYKFLNQAYLLETSMRKQIKYQEKFFDLISTPIFEQGMFKGALILVHDITLIKNAEKYQKRFTADVSHELRTPLSAIKGFSEILSRDKDISIEDREEFIELIKTESQRMETILSDLLVISKMDRVDYELEMKNTDIKEVINECSNVLRNHIEDKGLQLSIDVESSIISLDKGKISQVILNIIKNAMNYTDEGRIDILGKPINNEYVLMISDTGIGIRQENFDKIFKRFYRVDKARSRDTGGSGLGLSISKNVVLKHEGKISVASQLEKGTTFTIKLPFKK